MLKVRVAALVLQLLTALGAGLCLAFLDGRFATALVAASFLCMGVGFGIGLAGGDRE